MEYVFNLLEASLVATDVYKTENALLLQVLHYSDGPAVPNAERDPPASQAADHIDSKWWPAASGSGHNRGGPLTKTQVHRVSGKV